VIIEPFELKCIKREIDMAKKSVIPVNLSKIYINTTDAIWLVENVETLLKIAESWRASQFKNRFKDKGRLIDVNV